MREVKILAKSVRRKRRVKGLGIGGRKEENSGNGGAGGMLLFLRIVFWHPFS